MDAIARGDRNTLVPDGFVQPEQLSTRDRHAQVIAQAFQGAAAPVHDARGVHVVPRLLKMRVFLVAFGGRRRKGDIIDHLEAHIASANWQHHPYVCAMDLVLHPSHDAARGALGFWIQKIVQGFVIGSFQSPPCETWSVARYMELEQSKGPPPLRSADEPFGLPGLTFKQFKQLEIGSFLLFPSLAMITACALSGCSSMLEHPAFVNKHVRMHAASIWRLPEVIRLLALPNAALHKVLQGEFGMSAVKPTFLGAWGLPTFAMHAERERKPMDRSRIAALAGLNSDGSFKTAIAKEYAEPLCKCIAASFADAARDTDHIDEGDGTEFNSASFKLDDFFTQITAATDFGADFVDTGFLPLFKLVGPDVDVRA